jgi:hypothetical protein
LQGDYLQFSDSQWLASLHWGAAWIQWAAIVPIILLLLGNIALDVLLRNHVIRAIDAKDMAPLVLNLIPLAGVILAGMHGCWKITATEPGRPGHTQSVRTSKAARMILTCMCLAWLSSIAMFEGVPPLWRTPLTIALYVSWPIGYLALLTHLRELALRIPDPQLARDTRIAIAGAVVLNGFFGIWLFFLVGHYRKHLREVRERVEAFHGT